MKDYSILLIPTVLKTPFELKDIIYNCPVCDYEIDLNMVITGNKDILTCENCDHIIKLKIKNIK